MFLSECWRKRHDVGKQARCSFTGINTDSMEEDKMIKYKSFE